MPWPLFRSAPSLLSRGACVSVCVLGSVNLDQVLHVDHPPQLGETVLARSGLRGLGGKRFNIGP